MVVSAGSVQSLEVMFDHQLDLCSGIAQAHSHYLSTLTPRTPYSSAALLNPCR